MKEMLEQISYGVDVAQDKLFEDLKALVAIPSVEGEPGTGAPFGTAVAEALDSVLRIAEEMGFTVHNYEGYVGTIDWGQGDELIGVLAHVDIVPPGDVAEWKSSPYDLTDDDGFLRGRGVADDKGPLLSVLYGMYALKQTGFVPQKRVRVIIGTNEETGWGGINYYKQHLEVPGASFSPDGMFTVVNREKGIFSAEYTKAVQAEGVWIKAGEAGNLVPAEAVAYLQCSIEALERAVAAASLPEGARVTVESSPDGTKLICKGKSAHAMSPEKGVSAIMGMMRVLSQCPALGTFTAEADTLLTLFGESHDGKAMGIDCHDEVSGSSTANLGMLSLRDKEMVLTTDIRTPVTYDLDEIVEKADAALAQHGYERTSFHIKHPLYVPEDTPLIQTLCEVYQVVTQEEPVLYSIGGGTYARAFKNCVCFGSVYPEETLTVHSPNEQTLRTNIVKNTKMYGLAIYKLIK